jgi:hypothetical protein
VGFGLGPAATWVGGAGAAGIVTTGADVAASLTTTRGPAGRAGSTGAAAVVVFGTFSPRSLGQKLAENELSFSASTAPSAPRHPAIAKPPTMTAVRIQTS